MGGGSLGGGCTLDSHENWTWGHFGTIPYQSTCLKPVFNQWFYGSHKAKDGDLLGRKSTRNCIPLHGVILGYYNKLYYISETTKYTIDWTFVSFIL